ncbi:hypothetical protein FJV41_49710 [Myxococcus llanfairpwllgwyngyllgogerychwyrndrobwllllantysiliogogogochensis]|uniref:Uncharacterized protein n=1 Tax=Myxococcus llanfairpwllgwyngyllgogerychwyrndrobwllllantysiliogogogochensis TaxID=2590453 RepID=A0A540WHH8_9BACT|nr:hypothetical protein [Myxococcus llanfairpwllgwyngyllgogerychwyrndrobwllllantysiliogogogochensis]TQF08476.1 hypothetical protein FJV41_49710 [Myxococcus llanfairpwllgwyngyllgogerychwyrndrobwllllantysiliogogogochensis]
MPAKRTMPSKLSTDPKFRYRPAVATDIRKTFASARKAQARAAADAVTEQQSVLDVPRREQQLQRNAQAPALTASPAEVVTLPAVIERSRGEAAQLALVGLEPRRAGGRR